MKRRQYCRKSFALFLCHRRLAAVQKSQLYEKGRQGKERYRTLMDVKSFSFNKRKRIYEQEYKYAIMSSYNEKTYVGGECGVNSEN